MIDFALFSLLQVSWLSVLQPPIDISADLKVGERRTSSFYSCYLSNDEKAEDKGLPAKVCIREMAILLHPKDAFATPQVEIKFSDGQSSTYILKKEADVSKPEDKWPNWIEVNTILLPAELNDTGEDRLYRRSLRLNFLIERNSGIVNSGSLKFKGSAQKMADQYHPAGDEELITYSFDD